MIRQIGVTAGILLAATIWSGTGAAEEPGSVNVTLPSNPPAAPLARDSSGSLIVRVRGVRPQGGVLVAVFGRADGFPRRENATHTCLVPATSQSSDTQINGLPAGDYAIAIFQDLNDDGVLNRGAFGAPTEPYGFSNNARGSFGPPSFEAASFELAAGDKVVEVTLR